MYMIRMIGISMKVNQTTEHIADTAIFICNKKILFYQ